MATPTGRGKCSSPRRRCLRSFPNRLGINFARDGMQVRFPDRRAKISARCSPSSRAFFHPARRPRARARTRRGRTGSRRRGALRRVADGGGVLLRRQVRREGAVRFPGRILRASTRNFSRGSFRENDPNTTPAAHCPCSVPRTGETLQAHQRASRCTRSFPARRPPSPRRTKSLCRVQVRLASTRLSRKAVACRVSRIPPLPPVCLTLPLLRSLPRKSKLWELAESAGIKNLPGVHLESRREPGAP